MQSQSKPRVIISGFMGGGTCPRLLGPRCEIIDGDRLDLGGPAPDAGQQLQIANFC